MSEEIPPFDLDSVFVLLVHWCSRYLKQVTSDGVSFTDVNTAIMGASSKSCELDPIPTDILKRFLPELLPFITDLCNASLQQGCLPLSQRHTVIRPRIKKAGLDTSDTQNYRPVSNLTFISKIVERLVCHQLVDFLERTLLLPSLQSAYRKNHSTETSVLKVITDVLRVAS